MNEPVLTDSDIQSLKKGKYRYIKFVNKDRESGAVLLGSNDAKKGPWEQLEFQSEKGHCDIKLYLEQVLDLDEI